MKNRIKNILEIMESFMLVVSSSAMLIIVTCDVISRYMFSNAFTWTHEVIKFLYIWVCFIAIGYSEKTGNGGVISITYFEDRLSGIKRNILLIVQNLITSLFYIILILTGFGVVKISYFRNATTSSLKIPYWIIYSGFIIGISTSLLRKLVKMYYLCKNLRSEKYQ